MKGVAIAGLLLALAGPMIVADLSSASTGDPAASAATTKAMLKSWVCQTARDPADRGVSVTAVMRPVSGTMKMALRFQLLERPRRRAAAQMVSGGDLSTWIRPKDNPTLGRRPGDVWKFTKQVAQLNAAPAYYQFRVSFRWFGSHGKVLATVIRTSPVCFQPELRPDLVVKSIAVTASSTYPNRDVYAVALRNNGASDSGPFYVQLSDGSYLRQKGPLSLGAHRQMIKSFRGPVCDPSAPPTITVDPDDQVDDYNRANNSLTATCPGS